MQDSLFDDHPALAKPQQSKTRYALPPIPDTGWKAPTTFPRLDSAKMLCVDFETHDPDLLTHGPGWGRGVGHIVGAAIGTDDGWRWYFPMRHTVGEGNLPPEAVIAWLKDVLSNPHQDKVFANAQYDLGWAAESGITNIAGNIIDVQIAEPLLDEHAKSYSLDTLAQKYLGEGKVDDALYAWCQRAYGGKEGRAQAGNIWRAPPCLVGPYAEGDVDLPLRIWQKQKPLLEEQGLMELYRIEAVLPRILVRMRMKGVRVDVEGAERAKEYLANSSKTAQERIRQLSGVQVDIWAAQSIARALDKRGIEYPKTAKGAPSFTSEWLDKHPSEITSLIRDARQYDKAGSTFIDGYILDKHVGGRVHGQFHQLRGDAGGTISGRMSSSTPNLQNIQSAEKSEIGKMIRSLFLPEEGQRWARLDYSQIEFRLLCHYGRGASAQAARDAYRDDATTDFHTLVAQLTGLDRKPAKNVNFAIVYGAGVKHLANTLGVTTDAAKAILKEYHGMMPFVKDTSDRAIQAASSRGYVKTILGRRARFETWETKEFNAREGVFTKEQAIEKYGERNVQRAFTHKALNCILQGTAADVMKKALVDYASSGLVESIGYPMVTVHDELGLSVPIGDDSAILECKRVLENAIPFSLPMTAAFETGTSWGTCS